MLSYQHHYHVGNHADVLKHWVLFECLTYMQKKDKPFEYIDTHAGAGLYSLGDAKTKKLREHESGISRLLQKPVPQMQEFIELINSFMQQGQYPGSPALVNHLLRRQDKSWLFELHPQTFLELQQHCALRKQHLVRKEDGFVQLNGLLPVLSKRALVLIDPSYEIKDDYSNVVLAIDKAIKKMPQAQILLWYPVVNRDDVDHIEQHLQTTLVRNVLQLELSVEEDTLAKGMTGSGMLVVNPPWTLAKKANEVVPALTKVLAPENGSYKVRQLIAE